MTTVNLSKLISGNLYLNFKNDKHEFFYYLSNRLLIENEEKIFLYSIRTLNGEFKEIREEELGDLFNLTILTERTQFKLDTDSPKNTIFLNLQQQINKYGL